MTGSCQSCSSGKKEKCHKKKSCGLDCCQVRALTLHIMNAVSQSLGGAPGNDPSVQQQSGLQGEHCQQKFDDRCSDAPFPDLYPLIVAIFNSQNQSPPP